MDLREYVAEHGNSLAPHDYLENRQLGFWVYNQRRHYFNNNSIISINIVGDDDDDDDNDKTNNTTSLLTPSDRERVRKLDELGFVWDVREAQWLERYEELRGYVAVHGDALVPGKYCSKIMTSSSPLGGVSRVDDVGGATQCEDEDEENHHRMGGVVPKNNPILGRWVNNQRVAYKIYTRKLEFDNKWKGIEDLMDDGTKEEMERLTIEDLMDDGTKEEME